MYNYWGFGLHIASEIEFPELLPFEFPNLPDVNISIGITPQILIGEDVINRARVSISPTKYLLKFLNIANYYVTDGNRIIIDPMTGADEKSIRLFLLTNAMPAVLHQRDLIPLHASAIEHEDGVILFCGGSGTGKSTTIAMLQQKGYKLFSDDVCVLKADKSNGQVYAYSSYPSIHLWKDSFEKIGIEIPEDDNKIRPQLPKYARFYHDEFNIKPKLIKRIFILRKLNKNIEVEIKELSSIAAFREIQRNNQHPVQMNSMKKRGIHFDIISKITANTPVYDISRVESRDTITQLVSLVELNFTANGQ